jgi:hypothetical protein
MNMDTSNKNQTDAASFSPAETAGANSAATTSDLTHVNMSASERLIERNRQDVAARATRAAKSGAKAETSPDRPLEFVSPPSWILMPGLW